MFDDIYKNIRLSMSERLSSPLMTSFIISWLILNYRFVLIVFSSESIDEKLFLIDREVFSDRLYAVLNGFLVPLVASLFYIYVYPKFNKIIFKHYREKQKEILDIQRAIEGSVLLTKDESRKIYFDMKKAENEYFSEIESQKKEIERLRDLVSNYEFELNGSLYEETNKKDIVLNDDQMKILNFLWSSGEPVDIEDLSAGVDDSNIQMTIDHLVENEIVTYIPYRGKSGSYGYRITNKGRKLYRDKVQAE